jgi:uncharacterized protein YggE
MKKIELYLLVLITFITLTAVSLAQNAPTVGMRPDTVYVGADGKYEAPPDTALVQFNIAAQEPELKDAYARAQRAAEQIRAALRDNGLDPKEAEIGSYQVHPVYDYRNPKRKLIGYRVDSAISIKVKDFSKVGALAARFAEMDVTENQSIGYMLEATEAAKTKAVEDAFNKAKSNALTVARAGGRTLGELSYASVDTFEQVPIMRGPAPMMSMKASAEAPPPTEGFSPQKVTVTAHVNALFSLK